MLFSNRFGFLYIHIAKTGGTSIKTALKKRINKSARGQSASASVGLRRGGRGGGVDADRGTVAAKLKH